MRELRPGLVDPELTGRGLSPPEWEELFRLHNTLGADRFAEIRERAWNDHLLTTAAAPTPPLYPHIWQAVLQALRDAVRH